MRGRLPFWLLLTILVVFAINVPGIIVPFVGVEASPGARIYVDPASTIDPTKVPGSSYEANVSAAEIPNPGIVSYQVYLNWSDNVLAKAQKPLQNMNFTNTGSSVWTTGTTGAITGTASYGYDATDGNPSPGSGSPSYYQRATAAAGSAASMTIITNQSFTWTWGAPLVVYFSFAYKLSGNSLPYAEILSGNPSATPAGTWTNPANGYTSNNLYATSATADALQQYGTYGLTFPASSVIHKVEVGYEAFTAGDEKIGISATWDGGTTWSPDVVSPVLPNSDPNSVTWVDVTSATSWTTSKLSNTYFRTRVKAVQNGGAMSTVSLDWIPVRVTYSMGSITARLYKPDNSYSVWIPTTYIGNLKTGINSWSYNFTEQTAADFALSGTYKLQLRVFLKTALTGTDKYAQASWDDVGIKIIPVKVSTLGFFEQDVRNVGRVFTSTKYIEPNKIYVAETLTGTIGTDVFPVSGNGKFAKITWNVTGTGDTPLHLFDTKLKDPEGNYYSHDLQDGYFANIAITHDVAVTNVALNDTVALDGEGVRIDATVQNQGTVSETFDVSAYYGTTPIQTKTITLGSGLTTNVPFDWATAGVAPGIYTMKVVAETLIGELDTGDNTKTDGTVTVTYTHDISILSVTHDAPADVIYKGQTLNVTVVVKNKGTVTESFTVTGYNSSTAFDTEPVSGLAAGAEKTLELKWDTTTAFAPAAYEIKAIASIVAGELYTADNTFIEGIVWLQLWRDIAITDVSVSPKSVTGGNDVTISVTVINQGQRPESFPLKVFYNDTLINQTSISALGIGASKTTTFTWTTLDNKKPIQNMNFTAVTPPNIADYWATTASVTSGVATYGNNSALGAGNPISGGSGTPSYFHRANSTDAATANILFTTEQSFSWTLGTPVKAYITFAYIITADGADMSGSSFTITLIKPDLTSVDLMGPKTLSSLVNPTQWHYNSTLLSSAYFTQSGTYKLQIKSLLKTYVVGASKYVTLTLDDVGLLLRPPLPTSTNYIRAEALMPEDVDQSNNIVGAPYDVNGDHKADKTDWNLLMQAYGSKLGDLNYNANADFNEDNKIDVLDVYLLGKYYNKATVLVTTP